FDLYEIVGAIGAGGMGEVSRARATDVIAIKVLPDAFTRDPERLIRFEHATGTSRIVAINISSRGSRAAKDAGRFQPAAGGCLGGSRTPTSSSLWAARSVGRQIISVPTTLQPTFAMGTPVRQFDLGEEFLAAATPSFDVS